MMHAWSLLSTDPLSHIPTKSSALLLVAERASSFKMRDPPKKGLLDKSGAPPT